MQRNKVVNEFMDFFKDVFSIYSVKPDTYKTFDMTSSYNHGPNLSGSSDASNLVQQITSQVGKQIKTRSDLLQELGTVKDNDIVQTIIDVIMDDGFNSMSDGTFVSVEYKPSLKKNQYSWLDNVIQEHINVFLDKFDIYGMMSDIAPDFILYGEHFLRTPAVKGHGIIDVVDDIDIEDYMAIYKARKVESFVHLNRKTGKCEPESIKELSHFIMGESKMKVKIETDNSIINLPQQMRQGKSIIYPILNSLRKLNVLELSSLAMDLKRILAPILISVDVPANTDVQHISEIIDRYETYFNDNNNASMNADNFSMQDIVSMANRVKILPKYSDSKGSIESLNIDKDNSDMTGKIDSMRKGISLSAGIPPWYLTLSEQVMGKKDMLMVSSRYCRKLVRIQKALGEGIRNMLCKHLRYLNINVNPVDIQVRFKAITNMDLLDDVEYMVGLMTTLKDIHTILNEVAMSDQNGLEIDDDVLLNFMNKYTSAFPYMNGLLRKHKGGRADMMAAGVPPTGDMGAGLDQGGLSSNPMGGGSVPMGGGSTQAPTPGQSQPLNPQPQKPPSGRDASGNPGNINIGDMM